MVHLKYWRPNVLILENSEARKVFFPNVIFSIILHLDVFEHILPKFSDINMTQLDKIMDLPSKAQKFKGPILIIHIILNHNKFSFCIFFKFHFGPFTFKFIQF